MKSEKKNNFTPKSFFWLYDHSTQNRKLHQALVTVWYRFLFLIQSTFLVFGRVPRIYVCHKNTEKSVQPLFLSQGVKLRISLVKFSHGRKRSLRDFFLPRGAWSGSTSPRLGVASFLKGLFAVLWRPRNTMTPPR